MSTLRDRLGLRRRSNRGPRAESSGTYNPAQWLIDWFRGGEPTKSGIAVTPDSALRLAAVYACVRVRAEDVAKLPLHLYRRTDDGKARADDHPAAAVVRAPNELHTGMEFRETMTALHDLRGNAFAQIHADRNGVPRELVPLDPAATTVLTDTDGRRTGFRTRRPGGETADLRPDQVLHLRGLSLDGLNGLSPVAYHRETIGLGLAGIEQSARQFANDVVGGLILEGPPGFHFPSQEARNVYIKALKEARTGANRFNPLPLEWGFKPAQVSMTNEDAQYVENMKLNRSEIASIFRVPAHKIGILDNATFSNIEHQSLEYLTDTLLPILSRWEHRLNAALLTPAERSVYFFEHKIDGILRGDIRTRYEAYNQGRMGGWLSVNDIRRLENMNEIENGDDYLQPLNMAPLGSTPQPGGAPSNTNRS